jgi:hypothetical protein
MVGLEIEAKWVRLKKCLFHVFVGGSLFGISDSVFSMGVCGTLVLRCSKVTQPIQCVFI